MKTTQYVARQPDDNGFIHYPETEHQVWNTLITRQLKVIEAAPVRNTSTASNSSACPTTGSPSSTRSTGFSRPPPAGAWRGFRR